MAKKQDKNLLRTLRDSGLRKRVSKTLAEATGAGRRSKQPKLVKQTIDNLRTAADALERRVHSSQRSEAAKKAARTRKRHAARRSAGARKAARTRSKAA